MPIIKSARKRVKVARTAALRNARTRRNLRAALKAYAKAIESGKATEVSKAQPAAFSALDIAVKKDIIHRHKAARTKSRLAAQAKAAGAKVSPKPKAVSQKSKTTTTKTSPKPQASSPKTKTKK